MNRILNLIFLIVLTSCSYEPILTNKKYDFKFVKIEHEGVRKVNKIIKKKLLSRDKGEDNKFEYELFYETKKIREIIAEDKKGDPSIFSFIINLEYVVKEEGINVLSGKLEKKTTYNNIDDKFELSIKEDEILVYLSENLANEILRSTLAIDR